MVSDSHDARSAYWNDAVEVSKLIHRSSDSAKVISVVHRATLRALRATNSASPRIKKMNAAPTTGRKITRERMGQSLMPYTPPVSRNHDTSAATPISIAKA